MNKKKVANNIMRPIIILGIAIIPVMYSFFYLKAFWDPYSNLEGIPIAIVNEDKGNDDENLGQELVDKILEEKAMDFQVVDSAKAEEGLKNKDYYAVIDIPENFTETLNSADSENKQITKIIYAPNQKSNYLASQIINKAVTNIETELQSQVTEKVVNTLADKLNEVPDQMEEISDAAEQLRDGSQTLTDGMQTINNGMDKLSENYDKFNDGVATVEDGTKSLDGGIDTLNGGINELYSGSQKLASSTEELSKITDAAKTLAQKGGELNTGINTYVDGVNGATEQIGSLLKALVQYGQANPTALEDPQFQAIYKQIVGLANSGQLQTLQQAGEKLKTSSGQFSQGVSTLAGATEGLPSVTQGIKTIENGIAKIKAGAQDLKAGSRQLTEGANTLHSSSEQIKSGITELRSGSMSALEGSRTLLDGQKEFADSINTAISDTRAELTKLEGLGTFTKDAVQIDEEDYEQVDKYGIGFAPYFMALSLWIGGLIIFVGIYYDPHDRFKRIGRNAPNKMFRSIVYALIAAAQAVILAFILKWSLGFEVTNIWMYYGACMLVSVAFLSIIQFLMVNFGDFGKFLAILFLVLQLSACGGTFPLETLPEFYQDISGWMPMTYALNLFKEVIVGTTAGFAKYHTEVLIGMMVVFLGLTIAIDAIKMHREKKKQKQAENK